MRKNMTEYSHLCPAKVLLVMGQLAITKIQPQTAFPLV